MLKIITRLSLLFTLFIITDFSYYRFITIPAIPTNLPENTTHLVVLTGGAARIEAGLAAAENKAVKNVFITGVHSTTTRADILARAPNITPTAKAKITLDYTATTTRENAKQTHYWTKENNINTITLLTANYHMPRAQKLFAAYAPNLSIQPYGINRPHIPTKFYLREYIKSLMSRLEFLLK